jgi:hypothetical protein
VTKLKKREYQSLIIALGWNKVHFDSFDDNLKNICCQTLIIFIFWLRTSFLLYDGVKKYKVKCDY